MTVGKDRQRVCVSRAENEEVGGGESGENEIK